MSPSIAYLVSVLHLASTLFVNHFYYRISLRNPNASCLCSFFTCSYMLNRLLSLFLCPPSRQLKRLLEVIFFPPLSRQLKRLLELVSSSTQSPVKTFVGAYVSSPTHSNNNAWNLSFGVCMFMKVCHTVEGRMLGCSLLLFP